MKQIKQYLSPILFIALFLSSCSNELDLIDDWKETTVVYGLLDQSDSIQYIKIYKAFLGEGNALQMAQAYDSINYTEQLEVRLEQLSKNGDILISESLQLESSIPKDNGVFSAPNQSYFITSTALDQTKDYQLVINNSSTGNIIKAQTGLIENFSTNTLSNPLSVSNTGTNGKQSIKWTSAKNGKLYQLILTFYFDEEDIATNQITEKHIDWVFPAQKSATTKGGEEMSATFLNVEFYKFLKSVIEPNPNVYRYARNKKVEIKFSVAAEELTTYLEVYQPSTGVVQEKPVFTNIENGIGIFSSRFNLTVTKDSLTKQSVDSIIEGQYTSNLSFR